MGGGVGCPLFGEQLNAPKMKFYIKDFFSKCDQIRRKLRILSHLLKKSSMENFNFCAVTTTFLIDNNAIHHKYNVFNLSTKPALPVLNIFGSTLG